VAAALLAICLQARAADAVRMQIDAGKLLYVTTCASCHGSEGKGAIAPPLVDRNLPLEMMASTMINGRAGTSMPPFKDVLDEKSRADLLAYAQWLTSSGRLPTAVVTAESLGPAGAVAAPSDKPIAIGAAQGIPARGAALFFDPTRLDSCRNCHSYGEKGGPVGPDLGTLKLTPLQIYQNITTPRVQASGFAGTTIELRDGARITGIQSEETADSVLVFDVSSVPPVRRTVLKSDIAQASQVKDSGIYDHTKLPFRKQDWLDLSAYLGKTEVPPAR
jgi:putative heme-binding domain-containing protein